MDVDKKIVQAEKSLQRKLDWMSKHDNRVISATGIIVAMLGVLASAATAIVKWEYWHFGIYGFTALLLLISLLLIYYSHYPNITSPKSSLIHFNTISSLDFDEFKEKAKNSTDEEYLDDLLSQIYIDAKILKVKFSNLKIILTLLGISLIPWLIAIYISQV